MSTSATVTVLTRQGLFPAGYADISIAFTVRAILQTAADGQHTTTPAPQMRLKDYDADPDSHPSTWPERWDVSRWLFVEATDGAVIVGRAAVAMDTPGVHMLEGRADLAVLWDIRVAPTHRGRGVGRALLEEAAAQARAHGCRELKVETQDINVPACRFYAAMGCTLAEVNPQAYGDSDEVQLIWRQPL